MTTIWTLENKKISNCNNFNKNNLIRKTTKKKLIRESNKLH